MIVLDTHAFLWWAQGSRSLSPRAMSAIIRDGDLGIPAISLWELAMLADKGRIEFDRPVGEWLETATMLPGVRLLPITPAIAAASVSIGRVLRQDPADHLIAATALTLGAPLVTRDTVIPRLPGLVTIW